VFDRKATTTRQKYGRRRRMRTPQLQSRLLNSMALSSPWIGGLLLVPLLLFLSQFQWATAFTTTSVDRGHCHELQRLHGNVVHGHDVLLSRHKQGIWNEKSTVLYDIPPSSVDQNNDASTAVTTTTATTTTTDPPTKNGFRNRLRRIVTFPYHRLKRLFGPNKKETTSMENGVVVVNGAKTETTLDATDARTTSPPQLLVNGCSSPQQSSNQDMDTTKWAVAAPNVDISGDWDLLVTEDFKTEYDNYLRLLDQPAIVRSVALSIVGMTTEETRQTDQGRNLFIRGRNVRGVWERTLQTCSNDTTTSGPSRNRYLPTTHVIVTADDEKVEAESWWEEQGTKHRSWLRGVRKYGGGSFESLRYLESDDQHQNVQTLICVSTFHPDDPSRERASVTWRFQRRAFNQE
jgi:hypothetical protein